MVTVKVIKNYTDINLGPKKAGDVFEATPERADYLVARLKVEIVQGEEKPKPKKSKK